MRPLFSDDPSCVDFFNWCHLVPQHGVCNHKFYGKQCCRSCTRKSWSGARSPSSEQGLTCQSPGLFSIKTTNHRGTAMGFEEWIESQQPPESTSRSTWYSKGFDVEKCWRIQLFFFLKKSLWFALPFGRWDTSYWDTCQVFILTKWKPCWLWNVSPPHTHTFEHQRSQGQRHLFLEGPRRLPVKDWLTFRTIKYKDGTLYLTVAWIL